MRKTLTQIQWLLARILLYLGIPDPALRQIFKGEKD